MSFIPGALTDEELRAAPIPVAGPLTDEELRAAPIPVSASDAPLDFGLELAAGRIPGKGKDQIFGRLPDIDTGDGYLDVWNDVNKIGYYPGQDATTAETVEIFSDDANDNATGTGARTLTIVGLGPGFVRQSETVTLNGLTPVDTSLAYLRSSVAFVLTGDGSPRASNAGLITARQKTTVANVFWQMAAGANRTTIAAYTVAAGENAYIKKAFVALAKKGNASCEVLAKVRFPGSVFQTVEWLEVTSTGSSYVSREYDVPLIPLSPGTDIIFSANTDTNSSAVAAGMEVWVENT